MKTEELVALLATGTPAVQHGATTRRMALALSAGGVGSALLMAGLLGVRPTLAQDATLAMFWVKFAFVATLLAGGVAAVLRTSRPGARLNRLMWALAAPVAAMWLLAAANLATAQPEDRAALMLGQTWQVCAFRIALLSLPSFAAALWAMRSLAPTRLRIAGAAAGLCAGAIGALVYTFHCPELSAPFIGTWYLLGMLIPAAAGALTGPWFLRW